MRIDSLVESSGDSNSKNKNQNKKKAILMIALFVFTSATFAQFLNGRSYTKLRVRDYEFGNE